MTEIEGILKSLLRPVAIIKYEPRDMLSDPALSRAGNTARLPVEMRWPNCEGCGVPMVNLVQTPVPTGLSIAQGAVETISLFHCIDCWVYSVGEDQSVWFAFCFPLKQLENMPVSSRPEHSRRLIDSIVNLELTQALPNWQIVDEVCGGESVSDLCVAANPDAPWETYQKACDEILGEQQICSWLGGYAHGPQGGHWDEETELVVQVDSLSALMPEVGMFFGDCGVCQLHVAKGRPLVFALDYEFC